MRFTPTRVGTTRARAARRPFGTVHPHARGDNSNSALCCNMGSGSPPRAWGQRRCAAAKSRSLSVHPHARGDNRAWSRLSARAIGSPPRAWGQRDDARYPNEIDRFTPTRVGTTQSAFALCVARSVHPHARGDNDLPSLVLAIESGSPPRAWGQQLRQLLDACSLRFTPTRVGTTISRTGGRSSWAVHPHARGDNGIGRDTCR